MSIDADLTNASRKTLLLVIAELQATIAEHQAANAIVEATHRVAQPARPAVADMLERIRGSPVVHADETGWREGGVNGYVWTFSTPRERYFVRRGRGKAVVDEALGSPSAGCW